MAETREPQYEVCFDVLRTAGRASFGLMSNQVWHEDPKRLVFLLARYKFVAKMFSGLSRVLEVGCADAFGTRVVRQEVPHVTAVDFDPLFIDDVKQRFDARWPIEARVHDMLAGPVAGGFDGAYALDVLEHIPAAEEDRFVGNMAASLQEHGAIILGMPSLQSQVYASPPSRAGHVNCKDGKGLKETVQRFFHNVFIFSMNDEVVHTGFHAMAHYLIALGCNKKQR
jgi:2-polyprenyl-3-methyl-5-hydroxy-6-metoxy-1,4-benzoquinol methylase